MIINHNSKEYKAKHHENGAFYYSREICERIIPYIVTDRNWVTIRAGERCEDHSIVFIHNNNHPHLYDYLARYRDLVLVCGVPSTMHKVAHLGTPIYLPLSVDVEYVKKFKKEKTRDTAYVGRREKRQAYLFSNDVEYIENLKRDELLSKMAEYREIFAVGRTAIEGKILGCEVLPFDKRYPNPDMWQVRDSSEVISMLQNQLDLIDRKETHS